MSDGTGISFEFIKRETEHTFELVHYEFIAVEKAKVSLAQVSHELFLGNEHAVLLNHILLHAALPIFRAHIARTV